MIINQQTLLASANFRIQYKPKTVSAMLDGIESFITKTECEVSQANAMFIHVIHNRSVCIGPVVHLNGTYL